jgi:hypothetical protein
MLGSILGSWSQLFCTGIVFGDVDMHETPCLCRKVGPYMVHFPTSGPSRHLDPYFPQIWSDLGSTWASFGPLLGASWAPKFELWGHFWATFFDHCFGLVSGPIFQDFGKVFGIKFDAFGRRISESMQTVKMLQNTVPASNN